MEKEGINGGPLGGIQVLDLAGGTAGFCGKLLADLGACVIKVERPGGDPARALGPFWEGGPHPEQSLFFLYHNTNKYGITLELEDGKDRELLRRLLGKADVLIETFPPGYLEKLGLGFKELQAVNPRLILISVTGFGQEGPKKDYASCDLVAAAEGGQMYVSGLPAGTPLKIFGEQSFYTASLFAAIGTILALKRRRHTGEGGHIDISLQEAVAATLDHVLVRHLNDSLLPKRQGNLHWNHDFCCLPCRDGHLLVSLSRQWETLVELLDREGMAQDLKEDRWRDEAFRTIQLDHVLGVIGRWTKTHSAAELFELGQSLQFPWAPVCRLKDILGNEQHRCRGFFRDSDPLLPGGSPRFPRLPWQLAAPWPASRKGPPGIGEDNARIFQSVKAGSEQNGKPIFPPARQEPDKGAPAPLLKGLRVLDFTRVLAGPYTTRLLADFGAEVIKIQSERTMRGEESFRSAYYRTWNRNKRSITLNMGHPEARRIVLALAAESAVVAENFSPRVMANWGLGYEILREVRPELIMISLSAMGHSGPWRDYVAFGPTIQALCGLTYLTAYDEYSPLGPGYAYADAVAGLYGGLAVLAALEHRDRTGQGQYIDLSQFEALCTLLGPFLLDEQANHREIIPGGNRPSHIRAAPYGCYRCTGDDRWCAIAACDEGQWQALCRVMGRPAWTGESRFSTLAGRRLQAAELDRRIEAWTDRQEAGELVRRLQKEGVPAGVVRTAEDLAADPQLVERGFFVPLEHPVLGRTITDGQPIRFRNEPPPSWKAAPLPDEDNRYVYRELLGMTEAELADLIARGVIV